MKVAKSPVANDINKTVVLTATISGGDNKEPSLVLLPRRAAAVVKASYRCIKGRDVRLYPPSLAGERILTQWPKLLMFS